MSGMAKGHEDYASKSRHQHEVPDYILKELDSITGTRELIRERSQVSGDESDASSVQQQHENKKHRQGSKSPGRKSKRKRRGRSKEAGMSASPERKQGVQKQRSRPGFDFSLRPLRLMVYRNGDRETNSFIAVCNFEDMLSAATAKLHLNSAARKVFLKGGHRVMSWEEIIHLSNASDENGEYLELYISSGEPYRNPFKFINDNAKLKRSLVWTLNGIQLPEDDKRGKTAAKVPERLKEMSGTNNIRVLIFRNGNGRDSCEVVVNPNDFEHFLNTASMSLRFGAPCQKVFDLKGSEVTTLSDLELLPKLWGQHKGGRGLLYGPLWVSRGDGFSGLGSRDFILSILASLKERKKFSDYVIGQMELASDEPKKVTMKEFLSMGEEELYDNLTEEQTKLDAIKEQIEKLKSILSDLQPRIDEEMKEGSRLRMSHIKEFSHDDGVHSKLLGKPSLRVLVHENGVGDEENIIFYNMDLAAKISKGYENDMGPFLDHCVASCYKLANPRFSPFTSKPKILFDKDGREVEALKELKEDQHYWLSFGEPFMPHFTRVVELRENENDPSQIDVTINRKTALQNSSPQLWSFKKNGQICPIRQPKMCLTVKADTAPSPFKSDDGAALNIITVEENEKRPGQFFEFTPDGTIQSLSHTGAVITYVQTNHEDGAANPEIDDSVSYNGLFLREKFPASSKLASYQRFGLKQEGQRHMNEYRKTQVANLEWGKRCLSWPVDKNGELIHNFKWPMIGFLVCDAPSTKGSKSKSSSNIPLRLRALTNGCCDKNLAIKVLAPDVSQFLQNCTSLLQMPFAARRMFDENGIELFSLEKVERMSLIYVTSGEPWIDPGTLTGTDLHYAARLASDVRAIEHFVTLRECHGMCLEVEGEVLKEGALVKVGKCGLSHMDRAELTRTPTPPPPPPKLETEEERLAKKTPHFRTHYYFEMGLDTREWMNQSKNSRSYVLTPQEIPKPPPPVVIEPQSYDPNYYKQSFVFENGFVICKFDRKLALSVNQFGRACLAKLDVTDPSQQWHVNSQGNLYPGSKVDHVLTVSMPIVMPGQELCDAVSELYCGNEVQLQPVCKHKFGAANQKWSLDPKLGIIDAFATSQLDCDVTVANRSGVCTNTLSDGVALDQIGYTMTHHNSKFYLCVSCARVIRGSGQTMDKIRDPITFCCDIQPGNPISKVYRGSFKALSKKLDLSTSRASDTLYRLREKLNRIQNQKVAIADKPFSFYEPALLISVLAWKNGEPKSEQEPALVSGSSIEQILSAANSKLGFPASGACAEYVFTPEGELITTTEQLVHCSLNKYSQDQAEKSGSATFRKSNRENTFSKLDDDEISNDSPSTDITLRPSTAAHGKRGSSHNDTFENGKETSPSVESPLTRPGAPEPLVNLFKNANFRDREEKNDDVPSCWNAVNGAELICNFDDDLETTVCRVERTKPSSSISQDLSDVLSLSCRYKVSLKVFLEDLENRVFKCTIVFKRTRKSRAEVLPVISAEVNSGNWVDMRGAVNMPRSAESDLFQCNMLFAVEGGEGSFSVAELELKDDVSTIKSPDINLFENGELDSKNGPHQPVYWLPGNPSSKLVVPKPGTCEVTSINRQSDATPMSDGDDNSSQKDEKQSNFSCFYDVTHIISKENLYKLEVDFRALTAPGTDVVTLLSHKVSGQKEKTIELSKNEVHENSWCNVSCNLSLPHVSADELIEYCAIRFEAKNSFVFRKPAFYCCTAPMTSKSPPKSADGVISDEEDVPLDGQLLGKNNETHMLSNYGASMDRTELSRILVNHPLEVYVSSTSKFIDPKFVMEKFHQEKEMFNRRRLTGVHMDIEKHKLRLLKGRRIGKCSGARLEPTENPTQPVVVTGSWMDVSREEIRLEQKVQKLKKTYDTQNAREPSKLTNGDYAKPLRPQGKPVLVYKNGEDASVATNIVSVWANSLDDILVIATNRLKMGFAARKLYRSNGEVVASFDEIVKHELLCASQGENFVKHEDAKRKCFLKSRWARDKRLGRERPPDVVIKPRINPLAKVDPLRDAWYSKTASRVDANESQLTQSSITFLTQLPVS